MLFKSAISNLKLRLLSLFF